MEVSVADERREGAVVVLLVMTSGDGVGDYSRRRETDDDNGKVWPMFAFQDSKIAEALRGEPALERIVQGDRRPYRLRINTTAMPVGVLRFTANEFIDRALVSFDSNEEAVDLSENNAGEWGYTP
jgi:hypothetical protein